MKTAPHAYLSGSALFALGIAVCAALPQAGLAQSAPQEAKAADTVDGEVVVTGSRIRRTDTTGAAPVVVIDSQVIEERGFVQVGQALNQLTSAIPFTPVSPGTGLATGSGLQFPNLFNLGAGRTLSLVNGRRTVTSSSGLGDRVVDTNSIPTGLLKRIDVVQAGGAAVYGSDAIAGVINYVLNDSFHGLELDAQYGLSSRGDYPQSNLRLTAGHSFAEGRGNIAINLEYSKTNPLYYRDRPASNGTTFGIPNPADVSQTDGQPPTVLVNNYRIGVFNTNGIIFTVPGTQSTGSILRSGGVPLQFGPGSTLIPFNPGNPSYLGGLIGIGGDGFDQRDSTSLFIGVERINGTVLGHYDLTDHVKVSTELSYSKTIGRDPNAPGPNNTVIGGGPSAAISFTRNNAFLTPDVVATLSAASPSFAAGGPLYLSKYFDDLLPSRAVTTITETKRGLLALDGDFNALGRNFYWNVAASYARAEGRNRRYSILANQRDAAINAVRNGAGQIVCAINADAIATNDDPACAPINPFGPNSVSSAARAYISADGTSKYVNAQQDYLASIGGDILSLPAGALKFSLAYERRAEKATFTPSAGAQAGLLTGRVVTPATSGSYRTNEFSGEILIPVIGRDFTLPGIKLLELNGSYRYVDNSIAGKERVWGAGLRWEMFDGLTLRASRSRNFRAPTLTQLFQPRTVAPSGGGLVDPCDADRISSGPAPATRLANCRALFAANPGYGPLTGYQDPAEGTSLAQISTGGNPDLRNEISDTLTFGAVFQPRFVRGLTLSVDVIDIKLTDGLSNFGISDFMAACYDSSPQPADICSTFTRRADGAIVTGTATTFNAGSVRYKGEVYNLNYQMPLSSWFGRDIGNLELGIEATHNRKFLTSVTGFDRSYSQGTTALPDWVVRFDARYSIGRLKLVYTLNYLPSVKTSYTASIENTPTPTVASNMIHSISAQYRIDQLTLRAGINNLTDRGPSYPTLNYGDILGRQWFIGAGIKF